MAPILKIGTRLAGIQSRIFLKRFEPEHNISPAWVLLRPF